MTGERVGSDAVYAWTLSVPDAESGRGLGQQRIEGTHPGTADPVFTELSETGAVIAPGGRRMMVSTRLR